MEKYDSRKLRIEVHKADALRELRPHLDLGEGTAHAPATRSLEPQAAIRFLSRMVHAPLESLLESYPIAEIDVEAFTDQAIQDALDLVKSPALAEVAKIARVFLVDAVRVTYLGALAVRTTKYSRRSPFGALGRDHDYETWCRAVCESCLTKFDSAPEIVASAHRGRRLAKWVEAFGYTFRDVGSPAADTITEVEPDVEPLIAGKQSVGIGTAVKYLGLSVHHVRRLVKVSKKLDRVGQGRPMKISVESLRRYKGTPQPGPTKKHGHNGA